MAQRTDLINNKRPLLGIEAALQVGNLRIRQSTRPIRWANICFLIDNGRPRYLQGYVPIGQPRNCSTLSISAVVLYLAANPYSASAARVAVREEHQDKGASRHATPPAETTQDQKGATRAAAAAAEDQAQ